MKVLFILDSLNRGGAEVLVLDVFRNALQHDLHLSLVTFKGGELEGLFRATSENIYNIPRKYSIDPRTILSLRKLMIKNQFSIIHTHQAIDAVYALLAGMGQRKKIVLSWHGYPKSRTLQKLLQWLASRVDINLTVSKSYQRNVLEQLNIRDSSKFRVLYNGVDDQKFRLREGILRKELGLHHNKLFGMVANFQPWKDQLTVCQALVSVLDRFPDLHFVFIGGESANYPELKQKCMECCSQTGIKDRVHFLGKRTDVEQVVADLDCFILSSFEDTFGIAAVEAMMANIPCICSDIEPLKEVTDNGKYSKIFKTGDATDLAHIMIQVLQEPEKLKTMTENAKVWALQNFSINTHIENLKKIYSEVCAE